MPSALLFMPDNLCIVITLIFTFAPGPRNQIVMRDAETQLRHILTLLQQFYYGADRKSVV